MPWPSGRRGRRTPTPAVGSSGTGTTSSRCATAASPATPCTRLRMRPAPSIRGSTPVMDASWERYAWLGGIVFVLALLAESVVATGIGLTHQDSAATIATGLHAHEQRMIAIACISIVYAVAFVLFL